jgi:class 3 adenylate cyclase/tetratricopeptide (TPR) repeat protein
MPLCPRCGEDNPATARFCSSCGTRLGGATGFGAERKVVSILFVDLVGFTRRAELLDPEDVGRLLTPFYGHVRTELERFGGTVEKFIGDAVMAVFGAPVAHEDDPERAVRAAFAVRRVVEELNASDPDLALRLRIGVATGEVLIDLAADPQRGETTVAGDVVNTAARLQQAASPGAIVVGRATYEATTGVVEYRRLEAVVAKGKREPVDAWEATALHTPAPVLARSGPNRAALVGRRAELEALRGAVEHARAGPSVSAMTLVGEAGIGKSRLLEELHRLLDAGSAGFSWRQGRCLPYGDGVTFWAFAEIVKQQAGILETDSAGVAAERLHASVAAAVSDVSDAEWVERHLRPLVGLSGEPGDQREAFAAWRRYVAGVARTCGLLVLAIEDLHWADDGMLDLVEHFADWSSEGPRASVCTARPELLERRPDWREVHVRPPLAPEETVALLGSLLEATAVRGEMWPRLLAQTAGNPLYAEEYARMLIERPAEGELPLPESLQALIAARLDALSRQGKALLQEAAVIGKAFWVGALAHLGGVPRGEAERRLVELEQKGFVHPEPRTAVADEDQYAFAHVLIRDIAYAQIPRARRAGLHRLAGDWITALAPDRAANLAEMTAHHYASALEYASLSRQPTDELSDEARAALRAAGDHALSLNAFPAAVRFYERALALWPDADADEAHVRFRLGVARFRAEGAGGDELERARERLLADGDREMAAEADVLLAELAFRQGDLEDAFARLERAAELLAGERPSRQQAYVTSTLSRFRAAAYDSEEALDLGRRALEMATALGLDEIRAHALNNIGLARVTLGDPDGIADLEESVAISDAIGSLESVRGRLNLGTTLAHLGDLERAFAVHAAGRQAAERFGDATGIRWFAIERLFECYWRGLWDEALGTAATLLADVAGSADYYTELGARHVRGWIRLGRGELDGAREDVTAYVAFGREVRYPQALFPALALAARVFAATDEGRTASAYADELLDAWRASTVETAAYWTADLSFALAALARGEELVEIASGVAHPTPWLEAASAFAAGASSDAADRYAAIGTLPDEAYARLASGSVTPAADAFVRRVGAVGYTAASAPSSPPGSPASASSN